MKEFILSVADIGFLVKPYSHDLEEYCLGYLGSDYEYEVSVTEEDIEYENDAFEEYYGYRIEDNNALEEVALLRKVTEILSKKENTFLFHASTLVLDGYAYMFTGISGTGKTTHTKLWCKLFEDIEMLNDDKPFLKGTEDGIIVYGDPWNGKEGIGNNILAPLGGIICLKQAEGNEIVEMSDNEKWDFIFQQIYRSYDRESIEKCMVMVDDIIKNYPVCCLKCNTDDEAARIAYEEIKKWRER